jgi:hypothetical protein
LYHAILEEFVANQAPGERTLKRCAEIAAAHFQRCAAARRYRPDLAIAL